MNRKDGGRKLICVRGSGGKLIYVVWFTYGSNGIGTVVTYRYTMCGRCSLYHVGPLYNIYVSVHIIQLVRADVL